MIESICLHAQYVTSEPGYHSKGCIKQRRSRPEGMPIQGDTQWNAELLAV